MDSILLFSNQNEKLAKFLSKIGYAVRHPTAENPINDLVNKELVDLVLVDHDYELDSPDLCQYLRGSATTKEVPILCLAKDENQMAAIKEATPDKVEFLVGNYSIGALAAKVATELRLRKMSGANDITATLGEANAALRDLNERFKKELEQARAIQQGLLPRKLPKGEKFELTVVYKPLEEVGGDWYFIQEHAKAGIAIQVADVTGHGLSAAFVGCMTKLALVAAARDLPNELMKEMNRLMAPQLPQGTFVTMASCLYDPANGKVNFSRAGHPPPLVIERASGKISKINCDGFPLGFLEDADYQQQTASLSAGDLLILYTDGITEAQNRSGDQYGTDRLAQAALASKKEASSEQVVKDILSNFESFCEGRILKDDITLVVLKQR